ncbi:hypothetical protein [Parvularcula sp. IMCC14364]|uniref:hypothetical protein n=1 Tax=Parvularcula sp. IMCC14364 TaxID=3067902 RepID=UPI0027411766|nr:hypothetical protein [Parvularcula sp. IMCC14364]
MPQQLEADYLIIGTGAMGMAFVDVLLSETDASIIMVDKHHKAGGHWNVAYPFVTLHQPSTFYGVSSKELSKGRIDQTGLNKGLADLASGAEVSAYFDEVMRHTFLPSGRVQYYPMCQYEGDGRFTSLTSGDAYQVTARKTVDATWLKTSTPSTHTPGFDIAEEAWFMPPNDLARIDRQPEGYVVIGGGKTGIDTCLWLLENRVDPDKIRWIMPRDGWLLDRRNTQTAPEFFNYALGAQASQMEAVGASESIEDMFDRLESAGVLLRIDTSVRPKMFHGATISQLELEELRKIKNIIRMGRLQKLENNRLVLDDGEVPTSPDYLHIDCSASAVENMEICAIFQDDLIVPQTVRPYQPVFSAAFIAHVEATYGDDEEKKNGICNVVPLPNHDTDWIKMQTLFMMNQYNWSRDPEIRNWLYHNRLDGFTQLVQDVKEDETDKIEILQRLRANAVPAMAKLQQYVASLG